MEPSKVTKITKIESKSVRLPRVAPNEVPMVKQRKINHTAQKNPIATHNMATQIEYQPLPWYLFITVIDTETGEILQYKDLIQAY